MIKMNLFKKTAIFLSLLTFLSPLYAQKQNQNKEIPKYSYSISCLLGIASSPNKWGEWGNSITKLNNNFFLKTKWPDSCFWKIKGEKYFHEGEYSFEVDLGVMFPQKLKGKSSVEFLKNDEPYIIFNQYVNERFYRYDLDFKVWHNFLTKSGSLSFGIGAGVVFKGANIDVGSTSINVASENREELSHCYANSTYYGAGLKYEISIASDWKLLWDYYLSTCFSYCPWGEAPIKRVKYKADLFNSNFKLKEERVYETTGSTSFFIGLKKKIGR